MAYRVVSRQRETHSGQFMISSLDEDDENADQNNKSGIVYRFTIPHFPSSNPFNIELQDLSSLIENLSIAYAGNITSPKWNQFKGVSFSLRDKIRLNNIIWREFHRQYIYKFQPIVVQFQAPLTEGHGGPEAIILEGKYWKRKVHTISNEYQKWRNFFRNQPHQPASATIDELLEAVKKITEPHKRLISQSKKELNDLGGIKRSQHQLQQYSSVKFENNFNSLMDKNLSFPNHRDICMLGNADVMQPGLTQLQPTTEEIHDDVLTSLLQGTASPAKDVQESAFLPNLEMTQQSQHTQEALPFQFNLRQPIHTEASNGLEQGCMSRRGFLAPINNHAKRSLEQQPMAVALVATSHSNASGFRGPKLTRLAPESGNRRRNQSSVPVFPQKVDQLDHMASSEDSFPGLYPVDYTPNSYHSDAHLVSYDSQLRRSSSTCCVPYVPVQNKMVDHSHQHDFYQTVTRRDSLPCNKAPKQPSTRPFASSNHSPINWHTQVNREPAYEAPHEPYFGHSHSFPSKATQNSYPSSTGSFGHLSDNNSPPNQTDLASAAQKCGLVVNNYPSEERRRMSQQVALQTLHRLVVQHSSNPLLRVDDGMGIVSSLDGCGSGTRTSKANILQLSAKLIRTQRSIHSKLVDEVKQLRLAIENHRNAINACCDKLPTKDQAKPVNRDLVGRDAELLSQQQNWFRGIIASKTEHNWRWYIFGLLMAQLFESYAISVETASDPDTFRQAVLNWISHYCSLINVRPLVTPALCEFSRTVDCLDSSRHLLDQCIQAARLNWQSWANLSQPGTDPNLI